MLAAQRRHEGEAEGTRQAVKAARRQDAGDDLREAVDAHPGCRSMSACASSAVRRSC